VNALELVDLLLEVNVINVRDIDNEIAKLAARVVDPRAKKWFKRVPRFFVINIDRLLKEPYVAKAEPRNIRAAKYYADPRGGWLAGREPEEPGQSPMPVREQYDPKKKTYTTALHEPVVQKDIEQSFVPFKPAKAKTKRVLGEPPTKKELQPWMTAPGSEEKEFHHFDPIQFRRRELWGRLQNLVNYLNYQHRLLKNKESEDPVERANAAEAENMFQRLVGMKTDDIEGFRDLLQSAYSFGSEVKEKPWVFTKDGQEIASYNDLTLRKVIFPETAMAFSKRGQDERTGKPDPEHPGMFYPGWCTTALGHCENYTRDGPLYFVDKNNEPYVLVHFPSGQVRNVQNQTVSQEVAHEIAPLFADRQRFPVDDMLHAPVLAREVDLPDRSREVMQLPGGYRLVQFTQPFDLAREGVVMDHCCGNTNYQQQLTAGTHQFYSLRDPQNRSVVTIQVLNPNQVQQMKGIRNNTNFPENIKAMLRQIIEQNHWQVQGDYQAVR